MVNPIIAGAVTITMVLALVITILPGFANNTGNSGSSQTGASSQAIDSSAQQRITALETALKDNPKDVATLTELGNTYFDTGQYGKAIDEYSQVLEQTPNNTDVRTDMGISYYYLGMVNQAITEYKKALDVEPNKVQTLYNLGIAYADSSPPDIEAAVAQWQKVIQLYPGSSDAQKAQEMIDKYKK